MEHSLHLGAKTFLDDWINSQLSKDTFNEEVDIVEDIDPGDLLGKVLALITQVSLDNILSLI